MGGSGNKEQQGGESNEVSRVTGTFRGIFSVICEDHVAFAFDLPTSSSFHNNFVFPPLLNAPPTTHLFLYSFIHYTHSSVVHVTQMAFQYDPNQQNQFSQENAGNGMQQQQGPPPPQCMQPPQAGQQQGGQEGGSPAPFQQQGGQEGGSVS